MCLIKTLYYYAYIKCHRKIDITVHRGRTNYISISWSLNGLKVYQIEFDLFITDPIIRIDCDEVSAFH